MRDETGGRLSRRVVLGMAAAAPAVLLPAATAEARRRPRPGAPAAPVAIGSKVGFFTGQPGPISNGLRLTLALTPTLGVGYLTFAKLEVPEQQLLTFSPSIVDVTSATTVTVDVGPVLPGQLPPTFRVNLYYRYNFGPRYEDYMVSQQVTLVPVQGLGRAGLGLAEGSIVLGPQATPSGDGLNLSVTAVAPPNRSASFTSLRLVVSGRQIAVAPSGLVATGVQVFTVNASPLSLKGSFTAFIIGSYDDGGPPLQPIQCDPTKITVVPPQAFGRSRRPRPR